MGAASKLSMLLTTPFPFLCSRPSVLRLGRHSRVSIPYFSSYPKRKFSLNSRPQLGFSINASEELHTQTTTNVTTRDDYYPDSVGFSSNSAGVSNPWPEWSKLIENLGASGYFDRQQSSELYVNDAFYVFENLPDEFVRAANACLSFARDRSELLSLLTRNDIEVVVRNGSPFLFKSADDTARRMRSFLSKDRVDESEFERADLVDLMRFLLSYACNFPAVPEHMNLNNKELVESSVRNLLSELADASRAVLDHSGSKGLPDKYGQTPRPFGKNIEMKRGDWICLKCSFMNFAKNMKCLECKETRPKRQLTGGEWECPQCEFFNYGRNVMCLRCDCKRPRESTAASRSGSGYSDGISLSLDDLASRLATNDERRERWFSKASKVDNDSESEIMPLRKGVNRFVVSTRKTPLEPRLLNDQYQESFGSDGSSEHSGLQAGDGKGPVKTSETSNNQSLDRILGRSSSVSETNNGSTSGEENKTRVGKSSISSSTSSPLSRSVASSPDYVPFVPLPADMFSKSPKPKMEEKVREYYNTNASKAEELVRSSVSDKPTDSLLLSGKPVNQTESKEDKEQAEKSERWFKKVAELHDVTDLASAISDEDFPEIMPMRKGENRFVVSKKKDRSLTSPLYKRRIAMEQANNTSFVPFVPFPPDYFAKKDQQSETGASTQNVKDGRQTAASSTPPEIQGGASEKSEERNAKFPNYGAVGDSVQRHENQQLSRGSWNTSPTGKNFKESKSDGVYEGSRGNSTKRPTNLQDGGSWKESTTSDISSSIQPKSTQEQPENSQNRKVSWDSGFSGKSLEGSLVKEPDPLDMSEEAKAERWFRRAAQIKDISELSQIPDEDFPEIMPMRKGVNRFVVSKRKTPLERRLTSPQYRRNLPIMSSEPAKKEDDAS